MQSFFPYYGAKHRTANAYPRPWSGKIIEPFAGSAAYACHHPHGPVHLNDLDPIIYGIWHYLTHVTQAEIRALPIDFKTIDDLMIPQEAKWLIGFWCAKGRAKPPNKREGWSAKLWNPDAEDSWFWSTGKRERIAMQIPVIKHWTVSNKSYADLPNENATWFIDPPYQGKPGRFYTHNLIDFDDLGWWCRTRLGRVLVCENDGADWLPFETLAAQQSVSGKDSVEMLWQQPKDERQYSFF
jgi:hypothetical protein